MNLFNNFNIITLIILGIFFMPLLTGVMYPISINRIHHSLLSFLNSIKLIVGLLLSFYLVRVIFSNNSNSFLAPLYKFFPSIEDLILRYNHDIMAYFIVFFILLAITLWVLEILTIPLEKYAVIPLTERLSSIFNSMSNNVKRILSVSWQIPKSVCMVLIFSLLLNFYTNFINNDTTSDYINHSSAYQIINKKFLQPILSTDIAKKLPVLINDSFNKAAEDFTPANNENGENPNYWKVPVIKYFNGVTLEEAVKSNVEIDKKAKEIVGTEKSDKIKAYLLYQWISQNIQYDDDKATVIVKSPSHVKSGSIVTYNEREGVCFDYSCLYVSMCRSVGINVRFVTGLGYNGIEWGDHAWNQVYDSDEQRWINVDTTFGNSGLDYFDNSNFAMNHKYDVIQGEW